MVNPLAIGIAVMVTGAVGGAAIYEFSDDDQDFACDQGTLVPFAGSSGDGRIQITVTNQVHAVVAKLCVRDASGVKRWEDSVPLAKDETGTREIRVPIGTYEAVMEIHGTQMSGSGISATGADLANCDDHTLVAAST